jgi:hypothetical protein
MSTLVQEKNPNDSWYADFILSQSDAFLTQQKERLHDVERSLLNRIDDILPSNNHIMTLTQLAQICQCLNSMNLDLFERIKERKSVQTEVDVDPVEIRAPLDKGQTKETVPTTFSPFDLRRNDLQPYSESQSPLALRNLQSKHFANDSPSSFELQDEIEVWRARMSISLTQNDSSQLPHVRGGPGKNNGKIVESKNHQLSPSKFQNDVENRDTLIQISIDATYNVESVNDSIMLQNKSSNEDSTLSRDDDSISLATTVKGYGYYQKQILKQHSSKIDFLSGKPRCDVDDSQLLEVTIDEADQTNTSISYDTSTWDHHHSPNKIIHTATGDESLLVTPVLARYCLEPDDSSIGVKVVPTGRHRLQHENRSKNIFRTQKKSASSGLSKLQIGRDSNLFPIDEVESPTFLARLDHIHYEKVTSQSNQQEDYYRSNRESIKSTFFHKSYYKTFHEGSHQVHNMQQNITSTKQDNVCFTERNQFHSANECSNASSSTEQVSYSFESKSSRFEDVCKTYVNSVTQEEYDSAPSVIKMQVDINEVNHAIKIINKWYDLSSGTGAMPMLNEHIASKVFHTTPRKGKILLMSMCHWRRLNVAIDDTSGLMIFMLNSKIKDRLTF